MTSKNSPHCMKPEAGAAQKSPQLLPAFSPVFYRLFACLLPIHRHRKPMDVLIHSRPISRLDLFALLSTRCTDVTRPPAGADRHDGAALLMFSDIADATGAA